MELDGKVAIVTGAARGIGRAIALHLARQGADVVINYLTSRDQAQGLAAEITSLGRSALPFQADVGDASQVNALVTEALEKLGSVHILVNNAGIISDNLIPFMKDEQWRHVLETNLTGAFNCIRAVSKTMMKQKWGRIVNISSDAGLMGDVQRANYTAAKAGLIGLTKTAARELARLGITVNAVAPGMIEAGLLHAITEARKNAMMKLIPMGRFGLADEVAEVVAFLVSERARYITGQVICVDGGLRM